MKKAYPRFTTLLLTLLTLCAHCEKCAAVGDHGEGVCIAFSCGHWMCNENIQAGHVLCGDCYQCTSTGEHGDGICNITE